MLAEVRITCRIISKCLVENQKQVNIEYLALNSLIFRLIAEKTNSSVKAEKNKSRLYI